MIQGSGNPEAKIMLIGECFTYEEENFGEAFLGKGGEALNQMLSEAGIFRGECYTTNVLNARPPRDDITSLTAMSRRQNINNWTPIRNIYCDPILHRSIARLQQEIKTIKPRLIIAFGNMAMWALTGATGILKWRGSILELPDQDINIIVTLPPMQVLYAPENRAMVVSDLRRAKTLLTKGEFVQPGKNWKFLVQPTFPQVMHVLNGLLSQLNAGAFLWVDFDLETRAGHIACAGISWSLTEALCIPLMCVGNFDGYWSLDEEAFIVFKLFELLTHRSIRVRGQNLLYDCQYTFRHWHFVPRVAQDTMIAHHSCFLGLPKSLAFQASLYCDDYLFWKDDGKTWAKDVGEVQLWKYNCVDCIRTRQVGEAELTNLKSMGLEHVDAFQQRLFWPVLYAMQKGVRIDLEARKKLSKELKEALQTREAYFEEIFGHPLNPRSSKQMCSLFYEDLGNQKIFTRAKKGKAGHLTCDDEALQTIAKREPLMLPIIRNITEYRTIGVFSSTFVDAKLDIDNRMRCSYNICGTETLRLSSSKNAFDTGTNLQNTPKPVESDDPNRLNLPSVKDLFIPDEGYTFFDMDLDRADLQVVVWEAGEPELKEALRQGVDMHLLNAFALLGKDVALSDLIEGTETCTRFKHDFKKERSLAKAFIHGTNYGGGARTMAIAAGIPVAQAETFQKKYFGKYPGIKEWHERTMHQLQTQRYVSNILGYRRYYFESIDKLLPEALAWIPQSTVACVINRAWVNIFERLKEVDVLLQVHDSLAGQIPTSRLEELLPKMSELSKISLPYEEPLVIPTGIKVSAKSWGACE